VAWESLGFTVVDGCTRIGTVEVRYGSPGVPPAATPRSPVAPSEVDTGLSSWALAGLADLAGFDGTGTLDVDGLATTVVEPPPPAPSPRHANGSLSIDHVVVTTPDLERTLDRLAEAGLELRRTRDAGEHLQAFYRIGEAILEVVGPHQPTSDGPARLWGFVCTVEDLDATAVLLGDRLGPQRDAVQPGRRIATVTGAAGVGVPLAFMTPDRR